MEKARAQVVKSKNAFQMTKKVSNKKLKSSLKWKEYFMEILLKNTCMDTLYGQAVFRNTISSFEDQGPLLMSTMTVKYNMLQYNRDKRVVKQ